MGGGGGGGACGDLCVSGRLQSTGLGSSSTTVATKPVLKGAPEDQQQCARHLESSRSVCPRAPAGPREGLAVVPRLLN